MMKLLQVGGYWSKKEKPNLNPDFELGSLRSAFFKWKRLLDSAPSRLPVFSTSSLQQDRSAMQSSQTKKNDVLDWL